MYFRTTLFTMMLAAGALTGGQAGPVSAYWAAEKSAGIRDVVHAFNQLGSHAGQLRTAMSPGDAEAFDAVMLDMMGALAAIPAIRVKESAGRETIRPNDSRPDRIPQLRPDVAGLVGFFERLQKESANPPTRKLFAGAEKQARRLLSALPSASPTVVISDLRHK